MSLSEEEINKLKCVLPQRRKLYQDVQFVRIFMCETGFSN